MKHPVISVFWVCAFLSPAGQYVIVQTTDISHALQKQPADHKLMYMRMFTDMQQAVGHKLFLERQPLESLCANIRAVNPRMVDLRAMAETACHN